MLVAGSARTLVVFGCMVHWCLYHVISCDAGVASRLPKLVPDQVLKLKQLTVMTLAETDKVSCHVLYVKMHSIL